MSDVKLFRIDQNQVKELAGDALQVEKSLQLLFEANLEPLLARPIREGAVFLVRWMRPNTSSDEAHRIAFGFSTA